MKIGDQIQACARKTDGIVYRSWYATIESIEANLIVTVAPAGSVVIQKEGGQSKTGHHLRSYYWFDKFYNLIELFEPDGKLVELYINIASPPEIENEQLSFKDHELDVIKEFPNDARIIDEDEFLEAVGIYQYTKEFQDKMYAAAEEALELANHWKARPAPQFT
jgi:protein associated with RNAse G/E